jgi:Skp family chaperone for outer membrane proteins
MNRRYVMILVAVCGAWFAGAAWAGDSRIAVVDIERLIKLHPRTKDDRAILEKYVADYEAEREELLDKMKKMSEEFDTLRREAADSALSEKARDAKRDLAKLKLDELKELDQKIRETAATRQKELTSQELRMRKRVVASIKTVAGEVAAKKGFDFVLAAEESALTGYSSVLFYPAQNDITEDVLKVVSATEK